MIKAVFLDVGGTLLHSHPSVGAIYARVAEQHGVSLAPAMIDERFKAAWKTKRDSRKPVEKSWWRDIVTEVFTGHPFADFELFFNNVYLAFENPEAWRLYDDVLPTLQTLQQKKIRLAILSNWDERLPALLQKMDLERFFERQFISFAMGVAKPNPAFFKRALDEMQLHPSEAIHVGDDLEEDVKGAESAGVRAYHLDRATRPLSSRTITTLDEIFVRI